MSKVTQSQEERFVAIVELISKKNNTTRQKVLSVLPSVDDELLSMLELSFNEKNLNDDKKWVKTSYKSLMAIKPFCHPDWISIYEDKILFDKVLEDARSGLTFAFYWDGDKLKWER